MCVFMHEGDRDLKEQKRLNECAGMPVNVYACVLVLIDKFFSISNAMICLGLFIFFWVYIQGFII